MSEKYDSEEFRKGWVAGRKAERAVWESAVKSGRLPELDAAQKLCELYFNIAAEVVGEDEVRRRRDAMLPPERT